MSNSAFQPSILTVTQASSSGSGQGEVNVVTNPSAATDLTKWTATGFTAARATSGSPLDPVVPTGFVLTPQAIGNTFTSEALTVPSTLRNRKLKLEFYYTQASAAWKVDVLNSSDTRFTLTTDSSSVSAIPASSAGGKFVTYFDMDSGSTVKVRFTSTAASGAISVTQVIVGPGIQPQGAVVGERTSFTPSFSGIGTATLQSSGYWQRIGDSMYVEVATKVNNTGSTNSNVVITIPNNLTVDWSKLAEVSGGGNAYSVIGVGNINPGTYKTLTVLARQDIGIVFAKEGASNVQGIDLTPTTAQFSFNFTVPIAEWAGSGTVQLAQNDVEFAYNTSTTDASDTTSFGYGPDGGLIPTIAATAASDSREKRVRFQTPIQAGDRLSLEVRSAGTNTWIPVEMSGDYVARMQQNTGSAARFYGIGFARVANSSTDLSVFFGRAGSTTSGTTYGATGTSYPSTAGDLWRVRKSSAGAAVGFGIADSNSAGLVRNRTAWNSLSLSDISVSALGGGSVTVTSADIQYLKWKQIDDTVLVAFKIGGISVTGTVTTIVINLPASFPNLSSEGISTAVLYDNSSTVTSVCNLTLLIDKRIYIAKSGSGNFTASTDNTYIYGQVFGSVT